MKILREGRETGKVAKLCRKHGISDEIYYNWKRK
ncbi:MAG: transposase [Bdellovibrionales bacterium]|nr:transposase [Bdellovibrionales bacterium]